MELSDSWVEVHPKPVASYDSSNDPGLVEALLKEAQKEGSSRSLSGNNTPPSVHGSNNSVTEFNKQCADWIWDWSSRPEVDNSRAMSSYSRICSPKPKEHPYSLRKSGFWKGTSSLIDIYYERLSLMVVTHACSFLLGATALLFLVRKWKTRVSRSAFLLK